LLDQDQIFLILLYLWILLLHHMLTPKVVFVYTKFPPFLKSFFLFISFENLVCMLLKCFLQLEGFNFHCKIPRHLYCNKPVFFLFCNSDMLLPTHATSFFSHWRCSFLWIYKVRMFSFIIIVLYFYMWCDMICDSYSFIRVYQWIFPHKCEIRFASFGPYSD
jgi:hypothetical protein